MNLDHVIQFFADQQARLRELERENDMFRGIIADVINHPETPKWVSAAIHSALKKS